mgnify:CR=1 FL=1
MTVVNYDAEGKRISQPLRREQNALIMVPASKGVYRLEVSDQYGKNERRKKLLVD